MSKDIIKLIHILQEVLKEIGDLKKIEVLPYIQKGEGKYEFQIKEESLHVDVLLTDIADDFRTGIFYVPEVFKVLKTDQVFNLGYKVNDREDKGATVSPSILFQILATILDISLKFIEKHPDTFITVWEAPVSEDKKGQKMKYYLEIMRRNLPSGYIGTGISIGNTEGLIFGPVRREYPLQPELYVRSRKYTKR